MVNKLSLPALQPTPSVKAVVAQRAADAEARNNMTKVGGGDKIQVATTQNADANGSIKEAVQMMSRMEKVGNAQNTVGGKRRRKRRTFRRRRARTLRRRRR